MSEDRDELEWHFTFPPASSASQPSELVIDNGQEARMRRRTRGRKDEVEERGEGAAEEFVFVFQESSRPLVVLLGWAGCNDKYLAKYSAIYESRGCITLRCTAPVEYLFWRREHLPRISRRLIQAIQEICSNEHPVFFHIFSNGGAIFYQHISYVMQKMESPLKVKGIIFDSSPGERRLTSLYGAISTIIGGHSVTNVPISILITFFLSLIWLIEIIAQMIGKENTIKTDPIALAEEPYTWPQIFLYSNTDTLIQFGDVERFASRRAERGIRAQLVMFIGSPHVKHFAVYPAVYVSTVCGFINECLSNAPSSSSSGEDEPELEPTALLHLTKKIVQPHEADDNYAGETWASSATTSASSPTAPRRSPDSTG